MKFIEIFDSRDKKKRLSHIKNLVLLASSDGSFDESEMKLIFNIGIKAALSPRELERIFNRPESISFAPPDSFSERIEQLYDMVMVMMVDGEFHENEIALCKAVAIKLGFRHEIIDKIVVETIEMIAKGIATERALAKLMSIID